jgi:hypothetical protein
MSDYDPNSLQAVLSRIETKLDGHDKSFEKLDDNQTRMWQKMEENHRELSRAHFNLKAKVAGIGAVVALASTGFAEWILHFFRSDK